MRFVIAIIILVQLEMDAPAWAQSRVRLNWGAISGVMSGIWLAQEEGLFKKHGLDIELIHIASTSQRVGCACAPSDVRWWFRNGAQAHPT